LNLSISEFTAALGCVEVERLTDIVESKREYAQTVLDPQHNERIVFPSGMKSGYYKYITFKEVDKSTGKVYDKPCHKILGRDVDLPNTDWVADNHWCVPIYYHGSGDTPGV